MLPLLGGHRTPRQGILIHQRYFSLSAHIYKYGRQYKTIMKIRLISAGLVLGALLSTSAFAQAPAAATADQTGAAVSKAGKKVKDTAEEGTKKVSKKVKGAPTQNASAAEIADAKTKGMVWVNTGSGVYHKDGEFYGATKAGKFMTEADAQKAGYRAAKEPVVGKAKAAATK